jgi:hypothetical protein
MVLRRAGQKRAFRQIPTEIFQDDKMRCVDCNQKTREFLVWRRRIRKFGINWDWPKTTAYCREHLIVRFREEFVKSRQKMIVCYPDLEEGHSNYEFTYLTRTRLLGAYSPEQAINEKTRALFETWIGAINGKCAKCGFGAQTAYFDKGELPYKKVSALPGVHFNFPMIHEIAVKPEILCKACAFEMIEPAFLSPGPGFESGVLCPDEHEKGIYVAIEV